MLHAYVLLKMRQNGVGGGKYDTLIQEARQFLIDEAGRNHGVISYRTNASEFYVDLLGMIDGFCLLYSNSFQEDALMDILEGQVRFTLRQCLHPEYGTPYHGFCLKTQKRSGAFSWGRGVGWFLCGITTLLEQKRTEAYVSAYIKCIETLFETQDEHGYLWNDFLDKSHIDTSTTSMAVCCLGKGLLGGWIGPGFWEKGWRLFEKGIHALCRETTEDGKVMNCSGECETAGSYSIQYGNFFAQSFTFKAFGLYQSILSQKFGGDS